MTARARFGLGHVLIVAAACFWLSIVRVHGQSQVEEYRLKAAFLFHFAQFVDWPVTVLPDAPATPLVFCVIGEDPFRGDLEVTLQGKSVAAHPVRILHLAQIQPDSGCHVAFIDRREGGRVREFLAGLADSPVLTVGDSEDFLREGGMIRFCMEDRKVRFEINQGAAAKAHLKISARLLLLAKSVVGTGEK